MFSVIVPIYKVEEYLSECIESILAQTYKDFELILVNDGSPDDCSRICELYEQKDNRIKVIHKQNGGLMSARKAGLAMAEGDYICFIDGDDFIQKDMLETYHQTLAKRDADVICCGLSIYCNGKTEKFAQKVPAGFYDKAKLEEHIYPQMLSTKPFFSFFVYPSVCTKCISRKIALSIYEKTPDAISLGEDVAVTFPMLLEAESICVIDYFGYMYRQNPDSMTHAYDKNLYKKIRNLIIHLNEVKENYRWNENGQIAEYTLYILILAKFNEIKYNNVDTYRNKANNMKRYLKDPLFSGVLKNIKVQGLKNKLIVFCFKAHFIMPLYLHELIVKMRESNG